MAELFEHYYCNDNFHIKYARGKPSVEGNEFHGYDEMVLFLGGDAQFISKNIQQKLSPYSVIIIPKAHFHQFKVNDFDSYERCIIGFRENADNSNLIREVMTEIKVIPLLDQSARSVFKNVMKAVTWDISDSEKLSFATASMIQLLVIFGTYGKNDVITKNLNLSPLVRSALDLIDERFSEKLTIDSLAKELFVSRSTLSHKFSEELGVSIYKYITKKRLFSAEGSMEKGDCCTSAALNSGFGDYSCFYRLRKKYNLKDK